MDNILYLEKRGCDFWKNSAEEKLSDVGNYRVDTHGHVIPGKDGRMYFVEFGLWRNRVIKYKEYSKTGKHLSRPVPEVVIPLALHIDLQYKDSEGLTWGDHNYISELNKHNYNYTCENILNIINEISATHYDKIIFADAKAIEAIPTILENGTLDQKEILENLKEVERVQATRSNILYKYIDNNNNSFKYTVSLYE